MDKVYATASDVSAEDGVVHALGPDGVNVALTPAAAAETAQRLLVEAAKAEGQTVMSEHQNCR